MYNNTIKILVVSYYSMIGVLSDRLNAVRKLLINLTKQDIQVNILSFTIPDLSVNTVFDNLVKENNGVQIFRIDDNTLHHYTILSKFKSYENISISELNQYIDVYKNLLDNLQPNIILTLNTTLFDHVIYEEAHKRHILVFGYDSNDDFQYYNFYKKIDYVLTASDYSANRYLTSGLRAKSIGVIVDEVTSDSSDTNDQHDILYVNPSYENGIVIVIICALILEKRSDIIFKIYGSSAEYLSSVIRSITKLFGNERSEINNIVFLENLNDNIDFSHCKLTFCPALKYSSFNYIAAKSIVNHIPVIGSNTGALTELINSAGIIINLPSELRHEPFDRIINPQFLLPVTKLIERCFDDETYYQSLITNVKKRKLDFTSQLVSKNFIRVINEFRNSSVFIRNNYFDFSSVNKYDIDIMEEFAANQELIKTNVIQKRYFKRKGTDNFNILDKHIDIIAGCEFLFAYYYMQSLGFNCSFSFQMHLSMDPYEELLNDESYFCKSQNKTIVLSQLHKLVPAFQDLIMIHKMTYSDLEIFINDRIAEMIFCIQKLQKIKSDISIYILTSITYYSPAYGYFDYRSDLNPMTQQEFINLYKDGLYNLAKNFPNVYILDSDIAFERHGKQPLCFQENVRLYDYACLHPEMNGGAILAEEFIYQQLINCKQLKRIKCIVLDCDKTLYNGIILEDGVENIKYDRNFKFRIHKLYQLFNRGIMLTLCSKNDPEFYDKILQVFDNLYSYEQQTFGKLKDKFCSVRINWLPKSENIRSIASELNISLDSIAFFDDSEFERHEVASRLPEVHVFADYEISYADELPEFQPFAKLTQESLTRNEKYFQEKVRKDAITSLGDISFEDFLMNCNMQLTIAKAQKFDLPRIYEILLRTNQMNATVKRLSESEITKYFNEQNIYIMKLSDKFGDYGIIGTVLFKIIDDNLYIDEFALSCRAMGRKIEDAFLEELVGLAHDNNCANILINFKSTKKNKQFYDILEKFGFTSKSANNETDQELVYTVANKKGREFAKWFTILS